MSNDLKVVVRTWGHNREGIYHLLKGVHYPLDVVQRIQQWAVDNQLNLLHKKYCERSTEPVFPNGRSSNTPYTQESLDSSNKLWRELQQEGYNTEDDRHAITFLFGVYRDNPELINLVVTKEFLDSLEQGLIA